RGTTMMGDITAVSLHAMLPELYLCVASMILLVYGVYRRPPAYAFLWFALVVLGFVAYVAICRSPAGGAVLMNGMFALSGFTLFAKLLVMGAAALVLIMSSEWLHERGRPFEFVI